MIRKFFLLFMLGLATAAITAEETPDDADANIAKPRYAKAASRQREQIQCEPNDCNHLYFAIDQTPDKLAELFEKNAGKILIEFTNRPLLNDDSMENIRQYLREIAKRDGRVTIEPVYIGYRGGAPISIPVVGDVLSVGYSLFTRIYNYFAYAQMDNYHAKIMISPSDSRVMMVYFVHRNYGDICSTLYSDCDSIPYIDEETFDQMLSKRLEEAAASGQSIRVDFNQTKAILPEGTLDIDKLKQMNASTRMYKWFVAAGETEKVPEVKDRFLPLAAVVSVLKYSMQAYDTVKAIQLYSPARAMKAQIVYSGKDGTGEIKSVIFTKAKGP